MRTTTGSSWEDDHDLHALGERAELWFAAAASTTTAVLRLLIAWITGPSGTDAI
jgi:hypothetical protein